MSDDEQIDAAKFTDLLAQVSSEIHEQADEVKAAMHGFVIALGSYFPNLTNKAKAAAKKFGKVTVDQGNTVCKTPDALTYIEKIEGKGGLGKKRKTCRC